MRKIENIMEKFSDPNRIIPALLLISVLALHSQGFCDGTSPPADSEMNSMANKVVEVIFAPWVRKTALALGGGLGLFQSIGAGSFKPFMTWGGIGLLVNYIPKIVTYLTTLGGP
jgi:hypothetical protein